MEKIAEFLRMAAECKALASQAPNREIRQHYQRLAETWTQLAEERRHFAQSRSSPRESEA